MPDMREAFPSNWFSASDFDPVGTEFTIGNVMKQQVGAELKWVVYFNGQEKALVLNPTNNKLLIAMSHLGHESKNWTGKKVILYSHTVMFQGQPQQRIGVRAPDETATPAPKAKPAQVKKTPKTLEDELNDEIPI